MASQELLYYLLQEITQPQPTLAETQARFYTLINYLRKNSLSLEEELTFYGKLRQIAEQNKKIRATLNIEQQEEEQLIRSKMAVLFHSIAEERVGYIGFYKVVTPLLTSFDKEHIIRIDSLHKDHGEMLVLLGFIDSYQAGSANLDGWMELEDLRLLLLTHNINGQRLGEILLELTRYRIPREEPAPALFVPLIEMQEQPNRFRIHPEARPLLEPHVAILKSLYYTEGTVVPAELFRSEKIAQIIKNIVRDCLDHFIPLAQYGFEVNEAADIGFMAGSELAMLILNLEQRAREAEFAIVSPHQVLDSLTSSMNQLSIFLEIPQEERMLEFSHRAIGDNLWFTLQEHSQEGFPLDVPTRTFWGRFFRGETMSKISISSDPQGYSHIEIKRETAAKVLGVPDNAKTEIDQLVLRKDDLIVFVLTNEKGDSIHISYRVPLENTEQLNNHLPKTTVGPAATFIGVTDYLSSFRGENISTPNQGIIADGKLHPIKLPKGQKKSREKLQYIVQDNQLSIYRDNVVVQVPYTIDPLTVVNSITKEIKNFMQIYTDQRETVATQHRDVRTLSFAETFLGEIQTGKIHIMNADNADVDELDEDELDEDEFFIDDAESQDDDDFLDDEEMDMDMETAKTMLPPGVLGLLENITEFDNAYDMCSAQVQAVIRAYCAARLSIQEHAQYNQKKAEEDLKKLLAGVKKLEGMGIAIPPNIMTLCNKIFP